MASATLLKSSLVVDKSEFLKGQSLRSSSSASFKTNSSTSPSTLVVRAGSYADELVKTAVRTTYTHDSL